MRVPHAAKPPHHSAAQRSKYRSTRGEPSALDRPGRGGVFRCAPNNPPRPPLKPRRPPEATFVSLTTPAGYPLCYASSEACRPVGVRVQIFCVGRVQSARLIENRTCFQITHHLRPASLEEA